MKYTLSKPVEHGGKSYVEVTLPDDVLVEHLFVLDTVKGEQKQNAALMAALVGVPMPAIGKLCVKDYVRLQKMAAPLMKEMQAMQEEMGNEAAPGQPGPM